MKLLRCIVFFFIPFSLSAQEVFWQSHISVEHPLTGAKDTAWFGIGDVELGYNPYLDSLFYGNYDSLPDIRILGFDSRADTLPIYPLQANHCGDLHRDIRPLRDVSPHYYRTEKFEFMVWVDESDFELTQHARFNVDTTAIIELLNQNVAPPWNLPQDSVFMMSFTISGLDDFDFQGQTIHIVENNGSINPFYNSDWESDYTPGFIQFPPGYDDNNWPNARDFIFPLTNPPCLPSNDSIKIYRFIIIIHFDIENGANIQEYPTRQSHAYPNPTSGMLHGLGRHEKHLYNAQGKRLLSTQATEIDLSPYPNGLYFIKTPHNAHRIVKH